MLLNNMFLDEFISRGYKCSQCLHLYSLDAPILLRLEQFEQALVVLYSSIKPNLHPRIKHLYFNLVLN